MNRLDDINTSRLNMDALIRSSYLDDGASIKELVKASMLTPTQVKNIIGHENIRASVNATSVRTILDKLTAAHPIRFVTYGTIALVAGRSSNAARAVGRALSAKGAVTSLQAALVLQDSWYAPALQAYILPQKEDHWYDREGLGRTRYEVLTEAGMTFQEIPKGFFVPAVNVLTTAAAFTKNVENTES